MTTITIYGTSDDLVEVAGCEGADEFNTRGDWQGDLIAPDDSAMTVHDDFLPEAPRTFFVTGTGHHLPDKAQYVGTAPRTPEGLVWHLYELMP